jgi:rhodanese-related sulfurtransferase
MHCEANSMRRVCAGRVASAAQHCVPRRVTARAHMAILNGPNAVVFKPPAPLSTDTWADEPNLADIDRSIPQVDCEFIAELVRLRLVVREQAADEQNAADLQAAAAADAKAAAAAAAASSSDAKPEDKAVVEGEPEAAATADEPWRDEYNDGYTIIDCRIVAEATSWGMIEGAKIIPAHLMWGALNMNAEAFEAEFGFPKPDKADDTLLFYCQYGPRSLMAAQIASYLGYGKVMQLRQGYYEWAKQYSKIYRRMKLHDLASGNNKARLTEFYVANGLAKDIAPEFNDEVQAEVDALKIDYTRSPGATQLPMPEHAQGLLAEMKAADEAGAGERRTIEMMRRMQLVSEKEHDGFSVHEQSAVKKRLGGDVAPEDDKAAGKIVRKKIGLVEEAIQSKRPFKTVWRSM